MTRELTHQAALRRQASVTREPVIRMRRVGKAGRWSHGFRLQNCRFSRGRPAMRRARLRMHHPGVFLASATLATRDFWMLLASSALTESSFRAMSTRLGQVMSLDSVLA